MYLFPFEDAGKAFSRILQGYEILWDLQMALYRFFLFCFVLFFAAARACSSTTRWWCTRWCSCRSWACRRWRTSRAAPCTSRRIRACASSTPSTGTSSPSRAATTTSSPYAALTVFSFLLLFFDCSYCYLNESTVLRSRNTLKGPWCLKPGKTP